MMSLYERVRESCGICWLEMIAVQAAADVGLALAIGHACHTFFPEPRRVPNFTYGSTTGCLRYGRGTHPFILLLSVKVS